MATFSLVNLDKDDNGELRAQFLIKRAIGLPGDRITFDRLSGEFLVRPEGFATPVSAAILIDGDAEVQRLISPDRGEDIRTVARYAARRQSRQLT